MPIVTVDNITFRAQDKAIFNNLGITLLPGSIIHLKGANGSGKTSLLKILCGLQTPHSGSIKFGKKQYHLDQFQKPFAHYIGHNIGVKEDLTVLENIEFFARLYNSETTILSALQYFGLLEMIDQKAYTLSAGNKQKIALTRLMCCHTHLWLLDEVDSHLDKENHLLLCDMIVTKANNGGVIIMTSHNELPFKKKIDLNIEDFHA